MSPDSSPVTLGVPTREAHRERCGEASARADRERSLLSFFFLSFFLSLFRFVSILECLRAN